MSIDSSPPPDSSAAHPAGSAATTWAREPVHTGTAAPLLRDHIDTDALIASRDITTPGRHGLGARLLAVWRFHPATGEPVPDFVLNRAPWNRATVLLAGRNFGCGSSREMAVWALQEFGFRAVAAPSFGEIFRANALRNGLAPLEVAQADLEQMAMHAQAGHRLVIDLPNLRIRVSTEPASGSQPVSWPCLLDPAAHHALLTSQDPIEQALLHHAALQAHEAHDRIRRPWVWQFPFLEPPTR